MELHDLTLAHFRSHEETAIDGLRRINIFGGLNAAGKSAIRDAISVLLTGVYAGGPASGAHGRALRTTGARAKWHIIGGVQDGEKKGNITRHEGEGPRAAVQAKIGRATGLSGEQIRLCLFSDELMRYLIGGKRRELRDLLTALAPSTAIQLETEYADLMAEHLNREVKQAGREEIEILYKEAYAARRQWGQVLRGFGAGNRPPLPEDLPKEFEGTTLQGLQQTLMAVQEKVSALEQDLAHAQQAKGAERSNLSDLQAQLERAENKLARLKEELGDESTQKAQRENLAAKARKLLNNLQAAEDIEAEAAKKRAMAGDTIGRLQAEFTTLERALRKFSQIGDKCPTCERKLSQTARDKVIKSRRARLDEVGRHLQTAKIEAEAVALDGDATPNSVKIQQEIGLLEREQEALVRGQKDLVEATELVESLRKALEGADADHGTPEVSDEQMKEAQERVEKGRKRQQALVKYIGAVEEQIRQDKSRGKAEATHAALDRLVAYLGPDGLQAQASSSDGMGKLLDILAAGLGEFGFEVDFTPFLDLEDDIVVNGRPARQLSVSEQMRLGIVGQIVIAKMTGFNIICIDEWQQFDAETARKVLDILDKSGLQIFIFSTLKTDLEEYTFKALEVNQQDTETRLFYVSKTNNISNVVSPGIEETVETGAEGEGVPV